MKRKSIIKKIGILIVAVMTIFAVFNVTAVPVFADGAADTTPQVAPDKDPKCATILTKYCPGETSDSNQIIELIKLVINILTAGIGVLATIGMIICGYTILTARDNEAQVSKAKKRLLEIVIGLVVWILGTLLVNLLLPTFSGTVQNPGYINSSSSISVSKDGIRK